MNNNLFKSIFFAALGLFFIPSMLFSQEKFALVIGNGNYIDVTKLNNPVNDANDMANTLKELGFTVVMLLDGSLNQMEEAVIMLQSRLNESKDSYGFFFFSGHGVQSHGVNYLLPVDAEIPSESFLHNRALSMQAVLDALNDAGNKLNIVVLDACRDNPFSWSRFADSPPVTRQPTENADTPWLTRSISGGHSSIIRQPAGSIVVYATSAGDVASDGLGNNGLFTSALLKNMIIPGLDVNEIFRRTGADVWQVSNGQQIPAIYNQFFDTAYLIPPVNPAPRLQTLGVSMGSSFNAPWMVATIRGTIAPFDYSFLVIGIDIGLASGVEDVGYYSFCPFVHYALFLPFKNSGWYIGTGGGYLLANYAFLEGDVEKSSFVLNVFTGFNLFNFLDISYTLRTNFTGVTNKVSVGYIYRWTN